MCVLSLMKQIIEYPLINKAGYSFILKCKYEYWLV